MNPGGGRNPKKMWACVPREVRGGVPTCVSGLNLVSASSTPHTRLYVHTQVG